MMPHLLISEPFLEPVASVSAYQTPDWILSTASQIGSRHVANAEPNQDACCITSVGTTIITAVADGAGSQPHSRLGATIATQTVCSFLANTLSRSTPSLELLSQAFQHTHETLAARAKLEAVASESLASTLVCAVIAPESIFTASVGDSFLVTVRSNPDGAADPVSIATPCASSTDLPDDAGDMVPITHEHYARYLAVAKIPPDDLIAIILASDGARTFFSRIPEKQTEYVFFDDIVKDLHLYHSECGPRGMPAILTSFLAKYSPPNNDDRTLVIAYNKRSVPSDAPSE